ncbi:ABC transporter permease [Luteibacter aegosomatissinici]|uniref:ABC transporter permease n=1 Tax=Luteibacter aegosomatissinici TaxID=2911539 RepID=UPI001FFA0A46|nr:FtsX-like permease family protein [Luteibacter aegosomatissinici]UPG93431.1 FtsX-like permease family protein [Luteibacter aegosomatissinici]
MLDIRPILSTLKRHKVTAILLVLEIALTCAIVCNAVFLVRQRLDWMNTPSGIDEAHVVEVRPVNIGSTPAMHGRVDETLQALRQLPGVRYASLANELPFGFESWNDGIKLDKDVVAPVMHVTAFYGEGLINSLGIQLLEGRDFTPDEYAWLDDITSGRKDVVIPHVVIITKFMEDRLFHGSALGKTLYYGGEPMRVIGVVRDVARPNVMDRSLTYGSMLLPVRMSEGIGATYVMRVQPGQGDAVLKAASTMLREMDPNRVIQRKRHYSEVRAAYFASDRAMAGLLVGVCVALLIVTALGIVGLGSFWVSQRRRQIGVRRALGATRQDVLRYFQTENFLLATMGIALGMVLAYGINIVLMLRYESPRLPAAYLPLGAIALWLLGQAAVYAPARRASRVPPVEATRGN